MSHAGPKPQRGKRGSAVRARSARPPSIRLPYAWVLVVDDIVANLEMAKRMMRPYGMRVDCVTSGRLAVDAIRAGHIRYDVVFMDYLMPEMDGIEAVRCIREDIGSEYARTVPIIALTASIGAGEEGRFLSRGFQAVLSKPVEAASLDAVFRAWVREEKRDKTSAAVRSGRERRSVAERRSGIDRRNIGEGIAGLQMNKGIARFGGNKAAFLEVLRVFAEHTPSLLKTAAGVDRDTLAAYAIALHGLKASSQGICAGMVSTRAHDLAQAAMSGDFDFVLANNQIFLKVAWQLVTDIENMLANMDEEHPKPKRDKPDEAVLSKLLNACRNYDMDGVDAAMADLEEYLYEFDGGLVAWLKNNVESMNFPQVRERLSELLA